MGCHQERRPSLREGEDAVDLEGLRLQRPEKTFRWSSPDPVDVE